MFEERHGDPLSLTGLVCIFIVDIATAFARENMTTGAQKSAITAANNGGAIPASLGETVLDMINQGAKLFGILEAICSGIEKQDPEMLCSVLLLDAYGSTLNHGAAPSLPKTYTQLVDGFQIGPCAGSCGTAVYRKETVIVTDIAADPLWRSYAGIALDHGLRACWSMPIVSKRGTVLGTFAIYCREPRSPQPHHLQLIAHATHLVVLAIEHERASVRLSAAEARYQSLVERLPAVTYIAELGADGPWHYVSPQIESMLGFTPQEWLSEPTNWINRVHPEDREIAILAENRFKKSHGLFYAEYRMFARNGKVLWFRDEAVMLLHGDDQKHLMQGVMYDITEHKRLEEQLRHSQKMEAVGQLAGGVAHDFNNLLMVIQAHNSRLRERIANDDAEAQQDSHQIEQSVIRAASLTRQLLAFSRKQVLQPRLLDLNAILTDLASMLERLIEKNVELQLQLAPRLATIKADRVQIEQIILNLAVNARDAMPQGGRLIISTLGVDLDTNQLRAKQAVPAGRYAVLSVADTGIGMDEQTQSRIFEPFFTTKDPGKGTGLGLATVYGAVQQTGGHIWVSSAIGRGTTFEIYFPLAEIAPEPPPAEDRQLAKKASLQGNETILLVEDQDGIRDMAKEFLGRHGYVVLSAEDGGAALRLASKHTEPIHLLITDMIMPNIGGYELSRRFTQLRPEMKVLFMSGYPDHASLGREALAPDSAILQKPFSLDELAERVRSMLDAGA